MLISQAYKEQNAQLHRETEWGGSGQKSAIEVHQKIVAERLLPMLDYGCGRGTLRNALVKMGIGKKEIHEYDPGVVGKDVPPAAQNQFQLVTCTDVLEHIEPDCLDDVLSHIFNLGAENGKFYFVISLRLARRLLPDGRNSHLIVQPVEWWLEKLAERGFSVLSHYEIKANNGGPGEMRAWCLKK